MSNTLDVIIIDDEPDIRELLEITLSRMGLNTTAVENISKAKQLLSQNDYHLCLTDMHLPDGNGIELVSYIQQHYSQLPVAVITAFGSMETAVESLKAGAFDFVSKPIDLTQLRKLIDSALSLNATVESKSPPPNQVELLGDTEAITQLRSKINKLARSQAPVYISGESGTGKELVARLIHSSGPRADGPFIPVNCGAIPAELMESEFFGHKKGSFTGASSDKIGLFEAANGGTLFLDEVADLPLAMQVKLLRAIQEKSVRAVGELKEKVIDTRILSATHKDLALEVEEQRFRSDLYYRLNVIELLVPALRQRPADIPILCQHILNKLIAEWGGETPCLTDEAIAELQRYAFPGNVRELENILERAYTMCDDDTITASDLHLANNSKNSSATQHSELYPSISGKEEFDSLEEFLSSIEKEAIANALEETKWNKTAAAKLLGISFRALRYKLKKLNLE
ncbi:two-component system response regulator PilR (NtrC family) [Sinobacterium caligoides]|uniref:Two-component system response regulator PilR (NtrC family) n=1 Tax=Sinobacterium caligoides TaxID=933926 RepID=A0A3N2D4P0_9GAMM|nr:sigma-54 dependent transcriptional regulator [Sinobacterium caligoides]ROR94740.1 two-component system response regulator PilR (NtrC family) [Sinobacterium caligoides]